MKSEIEYDSRLHLNAGELRQMGIALPEEIPDCALTSRLEAVWGIDDDANVTVRLGAFHWIKVDFEMGTAELDEMLRD